jgi:serine/threonine protein kinase
MAPEMLISKSYDYRIDIWGLGILLYELLHGRAPFRGESVEEIQIEMAAGLQIKESLSDALKSLIQRLLEINPDKRIALKEVM